MKASERFPVSIVLAAASLFLGLTIFTPVCASGQVPPGPASPWTPAGDVVFPPGFSPPTDFTALTLDFTALTAALEHAPREQLGVINPTTPLTLPLPDGGTSEVGVVLTQMMEPALAAMFPTIKTYAFESLSGPHVGGHLAIGPGRARLVAQTMDGLLLLEPVQTEGGVVYVSYLDRDRTDGLNDLTEPADRDHHDHDPPPPPGVVRDAARLARTLDEVESGDQLRIYRLAASTTGEFYQARDAGAGDLDVVFSIVADLIGANAVFEPEVAVRLTLAAVTSKLLYDDPATDPFDNGAQCSTSAGACMADSDCPMGETCDTNTSACALRDANRDNLKAVIDPNEPDSYDLGFLFAARAGGGANGCAWFVVCLLNDDTEHKGRGAGLMGGFGTNSASGLLAHEGGHQLGARHTFSGQAGACTLNEFLAGDSESGYEPGSGTTRMSYRGLCADDPNDPMPQDDNVDTALVDPGSYYHSRSFDEIVDNVFSGDGATCGSLANTGNMPPTVDAGPDYTIPRQTPFTLDGTGSDDEDLIFNWEQFDRAEDRRPIDSANLTDGPIIRSVPPTADSSRTVPNLTDLLSGTQRKGEILSAVDRDLNFRLIARDNRMGGGGVAYDSMVVHVAGSPFFITAPNSGLLQAGCPLPVTWEVGGGDVADNVSVLYSTDGGMTFAATLAASTPNDGAFDTTVPCDLGDGMRVKVAAVDNIFFDVSDEDLFVFNNPPDVDVSTAGGSVDDACEFLVEFEATATDACGLAAADVDVEFFKAETNFSLGTPTINVMQVSPTEVSVTGSILAFDLLSSPAKLTVQVTAGDGCGATDDDVAEAVIVDDTPPTIAVVLDPNALWPPNHKMTPIEADVTVDDNCPGVSFVLTSLVSDEPDNGPGDGNTVNDVQDADVGTPDVAFSLRAERAGGGNGRVYTATYTATDGSENETDASATVMVPKHQ
jgi:hypothetical protein